MKNKNLVKMGDCACDEMGKARDFNIKHKELHGSSDFRKGSKFLFLSAATFSADNSHFKASRCLHERMTPTTHSHMTVMYKLRRDLR